MKNRSQSLALFTAVLTLSLSALAAEKNKADRKPASFPDRNVQVGGSEEFDACGGSGISIVTTTLFNHKNGMMTFDKVEVNQRVSSCDDQDGYVGIVFGKPGQECGVGGVIKTRQDYKGPCKSGWIKKEFFELLAG